MAESLTIPKIIHQLWIGDAPPPTRMMDTWKEMNPDFEYIRWTEDVIRERKIKFECKKRIREMEEINGQADIMRWELLYRYGGVFIDADSFCISPLDDQLLNTKAFAGWEHEELRPNLVATGTMGFPVNHPLPLAAIKWILENEVNKKKCGGQAAWQTVGPGLLTRLYNTGNYKDITIFPSYYFLPVHCTGNVYKSHGKVYAYQEWGSTKKSYKKMHLVEIPEFLKTPMINVSLLIPNYNTKAIYVKECLESIKQQEGRFSIDLVWIDDGSTEINKKVVKKLLDKLIIETRNITLSYHENETNMGLGFTLNKGVTLCSNELIFRMDADDIMFKERIAKQVTVMLNMPNVHLLGAQVQMFGENGCNGNGTITTHKNMTWEHYKQNPTHWFLNHPSVAFRKSSILEVGNYNPLIPKMIEDIDLWLRVMKKFGEIHNTQDTLLKYRLHNDQITHQNPENALSWKIERQKLIDSTIKD